MFRFEKDMIPVIQSGLIKMYSAGYFAIEFNSGNGIVDLVFATKMSDTQPLFHDYALTSIFFKHFNNKKSITKNSMYSKCPDKKKLNQVLDSLLINGYFVLDNDKIIRVKSINLMLLT